MGVGDNIKRLREAKGISQRQLAREAGISQPLLCQIERGTAPVGQDVCQVLADGKCPGTLVLDQYSEALREAIRCIKIVHGI